MTSFEKLSFFSSDFPQCPYVDPQSLLPPCSCPSSNQYLTCNSSSSSISLYFRKIYDHHNCILSSFPRSLIHCSKYHQAVKCHGLSLLDSQTSAATCKSLPFKSTQPLLSLDKTSNLFSKSVRCL